MARDVKTLIQWLNHDVLELAGPALIERQELYDFVVAELRLREGIGRKKVSTLRKALQNQRDDILGFAQVRDDKLAAITLPKPAKRAIAVLQFCSGGAFALLCSMGDRITLALRKWALDKPADG